MLQHFNDNQQNLCIVSIFHDNMSSTNLGVGSIFHKIDIPLFMSVNILRFHWQETEAVGTGNWQLHVKMVKKLPQIVLDNASNIQMILFEEKETEIPNLDDFLKNLITKVLINPNHTFNLVQPYQQT